MIKNNRLEFLIQIDEKGGPMYASKYYNKSKKLRNQTE